MVKAFGLKQKILILIFAFLLISGCVDQEASNQLADEPISKPVPLPGSPEEELLLRQYAHLGPLNLVPEPALRETILYFHINQRRLKETILFS